MTQTNTAYKQLRYSVLRGGRMTKFKGRVASVAPLIGLVITPMLMTGAVALGTSSGAQAGSCTETQAVGSGLWTCSGAAGADVTQTPIPAPGGAVSVVTEAGFGITSAVGDAIGIVNTVNDTSVTFSDNFGSLITGDDSGILVRNYGTGALSVTSSGSVVGTNGLGIGAYNYGTDLTVSAVDAVGAEYGIGVANFGTGAVSVTSSGSVVGTNGLGIGAFNSPYGTDFTVSAADVTGAVYGIGAAHFGAGALSVTSTGNVVGVNFDGIFAYSYGTYGTDLTVTARNVTGNTNGIRTGNTGIGTTTITVSGDIIGGGTGFGIFSQTNAGLTTNIILDAGANVSSAAGQGIYNNQGDSTTLVKTGASVSGEITLNSGSDNLTFSGGDFTGVTVFDGGDDTGTADGFVDVLSFAGSSGALTGAAVKNWERVTIESGSTISFNDGMLTTETLAIMGGGTLNASGLPFALTGNMNNSGTVNLRNGAVGDKITVAGNYSGSAGMLLMDVDFAAAKSDMLVVGGDVTGGTTLIGVEDFTPSIPSGDDVVVVDVAGSTAAGDFALAGGQITSGAFDYGLEMKGKQWVLSGDVNATGAVYEALPLVMSGFNELPAFEQRLRQRSSTVGRPLWLRFSKDWLDAEPGASTSQFSYDRNLLGLQAGLDIEFERGTVGQWVLGATAQHGQISAAVQNASGTGNLDSKGYGIGATATFHGNTGFYADLQGQVNWLESNITSSTSGELKRHYGSKAYALSVELGQSFALHSGGTLIPQAQLTWGKLDGGSFTDNAGNTVVPWANDSLVGRLGLTYQLEVAQKGQLNLIGNILHNASGGQGIDVAGTALSARSSKTMGEIGIGGNFNLKPNQQLYGDARYRQSLDGNGTKGVQLSVGFKMSF